MTHLNLSEWALRHRSMVAYLIVVLMLGGVFSYLKLGRAEDPDFTFKVMVVRTLWPGATAGEVELQLTERIEKNHNVLAMQPTCRLSRSRASKPRPMMNSVLPPPMSTTSRRCDAAARSCATPR